MRLYKHIVQYYETDRMGITHHSNYIRWMEEARIDFLNQIGWSYQKLESEGLISPVTAIDCRFRANTGFADEVEIDVIVSELKSAVLKLKYVMTKQDGQTVFEGRSEHCFLNESGRIVRLSKEQPAFYELLQALVRD